MLWGRRTVEFGAGVNVLRVGLEHHGSGLVGHGDHLIVDGLKVEVCHLGGGSQLGRGLVLRALGKVWELVVICWRRRSWG